MSICENKGLCRDTAKKQALRILFVEQEYGIVLLYREEIESVATLAQVEVDIVNCQNGKDALTYLQANHVDLIITAMYLPDVHGTDLSIQCKENFPHIPVMILSKHRTWNQHDKDKTDAYVYMSPDMTEFLESLWRLLLP